MPIPLRPDFGAAQLRRIARESEDAKQVRRLLALAAIYDGASRAQAAEIGGVTLQVVRDWVLRLNALGPERRGCGRWRRQGLDCGRRC
jgi:transposase